MVDKSILESYRIFAGAGDCGEHLSGRGPERRQDQGAGAEADVEGSRAVARHLPRGGPGRLWHAAAFLVLVAVVSLFSFSVIIGSPVLLL